MSNAAIPETFPSLLSTIDFEIETLLNDLKCTECKSVLKDAWQVPCGCQFCRSCIDDVMAREIHFCPGDSQECGETPLTTAHRDYKANKSIMKLIAKCPRAGCSHKCTLADMECHLRVCPRNSLDCPFRKFGCQQDKLAAEDISDHMHQESCRHSEILIGLVVDIQRDMEMLKQELVLKDEQVKTIVDEMNHVQNENKAMKVEISSITDENESMKRDKQVLFSRMSRLSERLEQHIGERLDGHEPDIASGGITAATAAMGLNENADGIEGMEPVTDDIQSLNRDIQSIKDDIDCIKLQLATAAAAAVAGPADAAVGGASYDEWLIEEDISQQNWGWDCWGPLKISEVFTGAEHLLAYQLASWNMATNDAFGIQLRFLPGPSDCLVEWPFSGTVTISVAHRDNGEVCIGQTRQCRVERPPFNGHRSGSTFVFRYHDLTWAGIDLRRGVRVWCHIVPGGEGGPSKSCPVISLPADPGYLE